MLDSVSRSPFELWHVAVDVTIATVAGGVALLILFPVTLCAGAMKGMRSILGLRAPVSRDAATQHHHPSGIRPFDVRVAGDYPAPLLPGSGGAASRSGNSARKMAATCSANSGANTVTTCHTSS